MYAQVRFDVIPTCTLPGRTHCFPGLQIASVLDSWQFNFKFASALPTPASAPQVSFNPIHPIVHPAAPSVRAAPVVRTARSPMSSDRFALAMRHCEVMQEILAGDIMDAPVTLAIGQERPQQLLANAPAYPATQATAASAAAVVDWREGPSAASVPEPSVVITAAPAPLAAASWREGPPPAASPGAPSIRVTSGQAAPVYTQVYTQ